MINNITAKLIADYTGSISGSLCAGENSSIYHLKNGLNRITMVDGEFVSTLFHNIECDEMFITDRNTLMKDGNIYFIDPITNQHFQKIDVSTGEIKIVTDKFPLKFRVYDLVDCGERNMLAFLNGMGIFGACLKTGEIKWLSNKNWSFAAGMTYYDGFLYFLHSTNFHEFDLDTKKDGIVLEDLNENDYFRLVIKNDICYFFNRDFTKIRTFNFKNAERTEIDIIFNSERSSGIERLLLNSEGNVIIFTFEKIWELRLD